MHPLSRSAFAWLLLIAALTLSAFWPGVSGGFLFDDYPNIVKQERVHITELTTESLASAWSAFPIGPLGRPLAMVSFAVDHYFFGLDPRGYKITSLAVHTVNALLVFSLLTQLLKMRHERSNNPLMPAALLAALWAIHPLQVSTVLYVVQRMEMLSITFLLTALICYLHGRRLQMAGIRAWPWLITCLPLIALGLLCKETAALFPAFALALELTVLRFRCASTRSATILKWSYGIFVLASVAALLLLVLPRFGSPDAYAIRSFTLEERLLTQLRVLPTYLAWIVIPQPANYTFYYDTYQFSTGLLSPPTTLLGGLFLAVLASSAIWLRNRHPILSLGIAWFFIAHSLTSNIIPLELVFEHRNYFAILGVLLALFAIIEAAPRGEIPRVRSVAVTVVTIGFLLLTMIRSAGWGSPLHLALELAERNPESSRASMDLGEQYMLRAGQDPDSRYYRMALNEFERGSNIPGSSPLLEQGLIILALTANQPDKVEWWDRLIQKLKQRTVGPQEVSMITDFLAKRERGLPLNDEKFAEAYMVVVNKVSMPARQYYAIGLHALRHLEDEALAHVLFSTAVNKSLDNPTFIVGMVDALNRTGHENSARLLAQHANKVAGLRIPVPPTVERLKPPSEIPSTPTKPNSEP
ncbi:hypothetical protein [Arenimonas caeni]|uniref:hypothetical protein n=1 Tax=Arenimonas caeni TaxID=2058085 RepID=UPI0013B062AE|nr:hypothetical protein [Arenimonas caeni]